MVEAVERARQAAAASKQQGHASHLFARTSAEELRSIFDGSKNFQWIDFRKSIMEVPPDYFYAPVMYLANLGLRPIDPRPVADRREVQQRFWFPENFSLYKKCRILPTEEFVEGAACVVVEAERDGEEDGKRVKYFDKIWFDPKLGYAPRKWEQRADGTFLAVRTNSKFEEFAPGCWLPWEASYTRGSPTWVAPELRNRPMYTYHMRLGKARVNNLSDDLFKP